VVTVSGDHTTTTDFGPVGQADQLRLVSPDGNRVALVVTPDTHNYASGDLVIVSPGGGRRTVAHNVDRTGGASPVWTPDSKQVMFWSAALWPLTWRLVAAADGKVTPLSGADWGLVAWSNNWAHRAS